jgi:hypothetical protein
MNANSQAQQGRVECAGGIPNYKNVQDSPPFAGIEFNDGGDDKAGEEDINLATANIAVNEVISGECAEGAAEVRPRPPSLPAFGSNRVSNTAATAVSSEGGRIESNMRMLMLSMQMQQTAQQISMQQQIFLQQMQMHMSAMEKHADTSKKYLWRIAKSMTTHNNKRKRGKTDEEDNDSSNDDK